MNRTYDAIIIGGGQAGLVLGYQLQQHRLDFLILDANPEIGGSWHHYWHSVTLFSSARYSSLEGLPFPAEPDYYPNRDDVIDYLQEYARHFSLPVRNNARVTSVFKNETFEVITGDGECYKARALIDATGPFNKPHTPQLVGQSDFRGIQLHSFHYRKPEPYDGQRIVVIGSNNSAVQIAYELAQVADVSLAVRKDIQFAPTHILGKDIFFFLHDTGFDMLPVGCHFNLCVSSTVYDDGRYQQAVEAGNPDPRPMFTRIVEDGVIWADGKHEAIDTIIYATGFSGNNKAYLNTLNALDGAGFPIEKKGVSTAVTGLFFIGLEGQIAPASATLRGVSRDARYIASRIKRYLS